MTRGTLTRLCCVLSAGLLAVAPSFAAKPDERDVARRVDEALTRALGKAVPAPPLADDETFLRRVSLDLTGKTPAPDEIKTFLADTTADKRARLIDRLLSGEPYAVNWGRYWRDVLTYHTPASGNYLRWQLFDDWMVEQLRKNRPWDEIVTALLTAEGINDECAPVNFLTALYGNPVEIAATTSRVFLGVQIQCAQCHDARTEPWKREQFHELVAFFGRAKLVQHKDVAGRGTPYAIEGRDDGQYAMTDKKNASRLIPMTPRFLTGESVSPDASDGERRKALARLLTSPKNPWFARAYVNRTWTTLMGWGFYPGLADLGGPTTPQFPEALDLLAKEWTATGYDMRWLFRTLALTQAYQRHLQPRPSAGSPAPPAVCPNRLRPEQVFDALVRALGFDENDKTIPAPAPSSAPAVSRHTGLRNMVYQAFKIDPSLPPDEVLGTIPQALLMMNSILVNTYTASQGQTFLAEALKKNMSDDDIVTALYERTLSRKPKAEEMATCRRYVKKVGDRKEALEDIFWSLVNSTEFVTRH
ncbi:MAG TPA: DUF1549 domain-containing protein [Gemmataceae bacterium]|nr:DUF1549 domain-containing protein [Gemmataceae bacterium]